MNCSRERIRQIEAKALRKLRHSSRSIKIKDYLDQSQVETYDLKTFEEDYLESEVQIVDGIKIERYNPEKVAKKQGKEIKQDNSTETELYEETTQDDKDYIEPQGEAIQDDTEVKSEGNLTEEESYLDEITNLLGELEGLDVLLKATSVEIKDEKDKKQKNAEIRAKMKKIDDIIQE